MHSEKISLRITYILLFFLVSILSVTGQEVSSKIDAGDLKRHITVLTSPEFEGRYVGTDGEKKTVDYLAEQLRSLGVDVHTEAFTLIESYRGETYLETSNGRRLRDLEEIMFQGGNYWNEEEETEVVFGGNGSEEELNSIEVAGRLVMVFALNYKTVNDCQGRLKESGAKGIISVPVYNSERFESEKNLFSDTYRKHRYNVSGYDIFDKVSIRLDSMRLLNVLTVPVTEVKNIMGYSRGKLNGFIKNKRIMDVPVIKVKMKYERIKHEHKVMNVIGTIKGKSDKSIVVSAHYDHLGKLLSDYYPGADDNASGVAALLEIAEAFTGRDDLEYSVTLLATGAEEVGLWGSYSYVNNEAFKAESIICNINMDMIARTDDLHLRKDKYIYSVGSDRYPQLHSLLEKVNTLYNGCKIDFSKNESKGLTGLYQQTDCHNFSSKGVPSLLFISGLHPDYHKLSDTIDKIDFNLLENRVKQIGLVIELLQREGDSAMIRALD